MAYGDRGFLRWLTGEPPLARIRAGALRSVTTVCSLNTRQERNGEGLALWEMAANVAVNVALTSGQTYNRYELLAWLNESLQTGFTKVEQVCTGAAFCQLMDWLFPGSLELSRVRFQSLDTVDIIHNYSLLQAAFRKTGVVRYIPMEALMKRNPIVSLTFMQWFKLFFDQNNSGREYHAFEARGGQSLVPATSVKDVDSSKRPHQKLKIIVKMDGKTEDGARKEKEREHLNENTEAIVLISDDEDNGVVEVMMEKELEKTPEKTERMQEKERTGTEERMQTEEEEEKKEVKKDRTVVDKEAKGSGFHCSETLMCFISRYWSGDVDSASTSPILSPNHPMDIASACSHTPYCLYLYMGVELGGGQSTSVILVGYFDQHSGARVVRLLDTLQMGADTNTDPQTPKQTDKNTQTAAADSRSLIETLKNFRLPLSNLAVFYCNAPHPGASREFESQLRAFSPGMLSLCGLPGLAARACHAGLTASFSLVVDLVRDVHQHYSTCSSTNDSLKELFSSAASYDSSLPVSAQCVFIVRTVQKMAGSWRDLVEYFCSLGQAEGAGQISARLMDPKVRLHFLFLSHTLEPLCAFQEVQQWGSSDVAVEFQLASMLAHSYTSRLLRPSTAERFLRKRELTLLRSDRELLPAPEVNVGARARDFLLSTSTAELGEQERRAFLKDVVAFYKAALESLAESIPDQLGDLALRNIAILLKASGNKDAQCSDRVLSELGAQLGLCSPGSKETRRLTDEYSDYLDAIEETEEKRGAGAQNCWAKLHGMKQDSILRRLFLMLLALPTSLRRTLVFAKVFPGSTAALPDRKESPKAPAKQKMARRAGRPRPSIKKRPGRAGYDQGNNKEEGEGSWTEDSEDWGAEPVRPTASRRRRDMEDNTEHSSDVVDVTEDDKVSKTIGPKTVTTPQAQFILIEDSDDDDVVQTSITHNGAAPQDGCGHGKGELVWGQVDGFSSWPGIVIPWKAKVPAPGIRMVMWYGEGMCSQINTKALRPFAAFAQCFCANSFAILATYREAILKSLQVAAMRCKKQFVCGEDKEELLRLMLDWAFGGFQPSGPDGFKPSAAKNGVPRANKRPKMKKQLFLKAISPPDSSNSSTSTPTSSKKDNASFGLKDVGLLPAFDDDRSPDFVPPYKKKAYTKVYNKVKETTHVYKQPDQKHREETIRSIMDKKLDIEAFCLCCGIEDIEISHPLFEGSLCLKCKDNFTETLYRYDEDGYQSYCTICCYGLQVILCGNDSCCRSYCQDCLNILVGPGTFDSLKEMDPWICYLCQPHRPHFALVPREDWSIRVQELFANNSAMEFEPHRVYPSIPANLRRPIRVLSLFDGIATGYLVLKDLGFKVEKYIASEICEDSIAVATINHEGRIVQVDDVRSITKEHIEEWGPFDLLIGGSPCNDLSIVNPIRKGLYEGTGRLFFEYYRILHLMKPREEDSRPFFWLFENVVFMNTHDKVNICRFLECNPVLVDAVKVSPAHRARYFWGNIPGMNRPITASQNDKLNLQECLEIGREARFNKVRTITTNPNSLKQGKHVALLPVMQNGKEDILWITELEKIFGFPKHYTDVRNMNRQQRQKVLGKSWSVPVIRHLFAPLKDYFACEELPPITSSSTSTSSPIASRSPSPSRTPSPTPSACLELQPLE
uniref:uncharacterized protein n=1 Tax=Centroberyx gerrardi TaxID=166262 RepID=UPI003AADEB4B